LWQALLQGKSLISSVEPSRWGQDALLHPRRSEPGSAYTFAAGSIGDVAGFDAAFFGISPREAGQMDPQQRLLLELTWEALESAGIPPSSIRGRRWSVYLGLSTLDYAYRRAEDLAAVDATTMTGNTASVAANRISYVFDLRGPSMAVDTACSSALVAFHQACLSIRCGESAAAVVGGISLHLHPYPFIGFSKASMLSRSGRCSVFDAAADGYVRAEGGAVVILKPLEQALADGNRVLALVAGSGVNTDGHKQGLSVPSHAVQADLLREVYAQAGIAPGEIDYLEAHGTGTAVGDPIEAHALGEAIGQARAAGKPLPIGSIKSNLGHLEAASGMAGLAKALLVIQHRCVPPTINLEPPNPNELTPTTTRCRCRQTNGWWSASTRSGSAAPTRTWCLQATKMELSRRLGCPAICPPLVHRSSFRHAVFRRCASQPPAWPGTCSTTRKSRSSTSRTAHFSIATPTRWVCLPTARIEPRSPTACSGSRPPAPPRALSPAATCPTRPRLPSCTPAMARNGPAWDSACSKRTKRSGARSRKSMRCLLPRAVHRSSMN